VVGPRGGEKYETQLTQKGKGREPGVSLPYIARRRDTTGATGSCELVSALWSLVDSCFWTGQCSILCIICSTRPWCSMDTVADGDAGGRGGVGATALPHTPHTRKSFVPAHPQLVTELQLASKTASESCAVLALSSVNFL
jgi:hypothetical protein